MDKIIIIIIFSFLYGCASEYPCGEPNKGKCMSVSDNYKQSYSNYVNPDDLQDGKINWSSESTTSKKMNFTQYPQIPSDNAPLISSPKMIRVWITPFTDSDNIFHDQSYEFMIIDKGHWNYSNNKLLMNKNLKNVYPSQVSYIQRGDYGTKIQKSETPKFPAIDALQNQRVPLITTTTTGSGVNKITTITP